MIYGNSNNNHLHTVGITDGVHFNNRNKTKTMKEIEKKILGIINGRFEISTWQIGNSLKGNYKTLVIFLKSNNWNFTIYVNGSIEPNTEKQLFINLENYINENLNYIIEKSKNYNYEPNTIRHQKRVPSIDKRN